MLPQASKQHLQHTKALPALWPAPWQTCIIKVQSCLTLLQGIVQQVEDAVQQACNQMQDSSSPVAPQWGAAEAARGQGSGTRAAAPVHQDVKGTWTGSLEAYGGGGGASNVDFNVKGTGWQWAEYKTDQVSCAVLCCAVLSCAVLLWQQFCLCNEQQAVDVASAAA